MFSILDIDIKKTIYQISIPVIIFISIYVILLAIYSSKAKQKKNKNYIYNINFNLYVIGILMQTFILEIYLIYLISKVKYENILNISSILAATFLLIILCQLLTNFTELIRKEDKSLNNINNNKELQLMLNDIEQL